MTSNRYALLGMIKNAIVRLQLNLNESHDEQVFSNTKKITKISSTSKKLWDMNLSKTINKIESSLKNDSVTN